MSLQYRVIGTMIVINLDIMMAKRKISSGELAERVGITQANLSILKTTRRGAIRFSTLEKLCEVLECQPGDILEYRSDEIMCDTVISDPFRRFKRKFLPGRKGTRCLRS